MVKSKTEPQITDTEQFAPLLFRFSSKSYLEEHLLARPS